MADLENAERVVADELSPFNLFLQSLGDPGARRGSRRSW